ncbi:MAG: hypothetical protein ACREPN_01605 [Rudaea sp.]
MTAAGVPMLDSRDRRRFFVLALAVVFLALAVRVVYVNVARVDFPIRGDVNQYVLYAWNLVHRGVFSTSLPDAAVAMPDSYRGPGYPAFLALMMQLAGHSDLPLRPGPHGLMVLGFATDTWMRYTLALQVVLSVATVGLTILIARLWLSRGVALCAGLLVALWPHLITFTGALLSETLFAFAVTLALWLVCVAARKRSVALTAAAGAVLALAYLVNPVIAIFPLLAAGVLWAGCKRKLAVVLLLVFVVAPLGWGLRNAQLSGGQGALARAEQNFVVGAWPQFYAAYNSRFDNAISARILQAEREEEAAFARDPAHGLALMRERMALDPGYFATWYLLEKPWLFWDWSIRIGAGDIYFLETTHSPFVRYTALRMIERTLRLFNPVLFALALVATLLWLWRFVADRGPARADMPILPIVLFVYVTAVYVALQAEPRYSIPFRPIEILLACWALTQIAAGVRRRLGKTGTSPVVCAPAGADHGETNHRD